MARLKDNPIPISLDERDFDGEDYEYGEFLKLSEEGLAALRAEYAKQIADSAVAVAKADLVEASRSMLEQANDMTKWKWDGDA